MFRCFRGRIYDSESGEKICDEENYFIYKEYAYKLEGNNFVCFNLKTKETSIWDMPAEDVIVRGCFLIDGQKNIYGIDFDNKKFRLIYDAPGTSIFSLESKDALIISSETYPYDILLHKDGHIVELPLLPSSFRARVIGDMLIVSPETYYRTTIYDIIHGKQLYSVEHPEYGHSIHFHNGILVFDRFTFLDLETGEIKFSDKNIVYYDSWWEEDRFYFIHEVRDDKFSIREIIFEELNPNLPK